MDISIRPLSISDMEDIARLANDRDIARMIARLPWPYTREDAQKWVDGFPDKPNEHAFAVLCDKEFAGVVGLTHDPEHGRAELGYWLGRPWWGKGIATAAARLAVEYAFQKLRVRRVYAYCFAVNAASRRVLEKNGLKKRAA